MSMTYDEMYKRILETVKQYPGITSAEIARKIKVHNQTIKKHLLKIEKEKGNVKSRKVGKRNLHWYPNES
jgi:predicted ArsR family transcriptional regulator